MFVSPLDKSRAALSIPLLIQSQAQITEFRMQPLPLLCGASFINSLSGFHNPDHKFLVRLSFSFP